MSFIDEVKRFDSQNLRSTPTIVTKLDGTRFIEEDVPNDEGESGRIRSILERRSHGFVVDPHPDLTVSEVLPGVYIGAQDAAHDGETIRKLGINHILNCGYGIVNIMDDITYMNVELLDNPEQDIRPILQKCFLFIENALGKGGSILIHCNAGVSRSVAIAMAYIMKEKKINVDEAFNMIRLKRPSACPNAGFLIQLREFQRELGL